MGAIYTDEYHSAGGIGADLKVGERGLSEVSKKEEGDPVVKTGKEWPGR